MEWDENKVLLSGIDETHSVPWLPDWFPFLYAGDSCFILFFCSLDRALMESHLVYFHLMLYWNTRIVVGVNMLRTQ
jgi:hypothetical protein